MFETDEAIAQNLLPTHTTDSPERRALTAICILIYDIDISEKLA